MSPATADEISNGNTTEWPSEPSAEMMTKIAITHEFTGFEVSARQGLWRIKT
jgi:hypothetical protein